MRTLMFLQILGLFMIASSTVLLAAGQPIIVGNQIVCLGSIKDDTETDEYLKLVLQNKDSLRTTEDRSHQTVPFIELGRDLVTRRRFQIALAENGQYFNQTFWLYRVLHQRPKLILRSQYGAAVSTVAEQMRLEVSSPKLTFVSLLNKDEHRDHLLEGSLLVNLSDDRDSIVSKNLICDVFPAVKQ